MKRNSDNAATGRDGFNISELYDTEDLLLSDDPGGMDNIIEYNRQEFYKEWFEYVDEMA